MIKPSYMLTVAAGVLFFNLGNAQAVSASALQAQTTQNAASPIENKPAQNTLLEPSDLKTILPPSVFFKGQSAPLQLRNASGIHFTDGAFLFASLVDTSGYSSGVQEKYQAYFVTEVPLIFGEHKLSAGAYGVGFIANNKFLVMDIGGHDLFEVNSARDEALHHPIPLKVTQAPESESYRLYAGRNYVGFQRGS